MEAIKLLNAGALTAAPGLIGWTLVSHCGGASTGGIIVETEAYRAADDAASHSHRGKTRRNAPMWEEAGTIYVYFSYGLHFAMNLAAGPVGESEAVLLRALEPTIGLDMMAQRRGLPDPRRLASGPAKLTQALGIDLSLTGTHLAAGIIELLPPVNLIASELVGSSSRIGITRATELPWRFFLKGSQYLSRPAG